MNNNISKGNIYEKVTEWLDLYHSSDDEQVKKDLKAKIVSKMVPVVKNIAKTIARRDYDPIEDLVQAGFIGLLKAIDRYSQARNNNFRVYAGYLIIGEMKHYLRDKATAIRVPAYIQELTVRINNFTKDLTEEEVSRLTSEDVAEALNVSTSAVNIAMQADRRRSTLSLEDVYSTDEDSLNFEEIIAGEDYKTKAELEDARIIINKAIRMLPPDERKIVDMFYNQDMTRKEIADALVLSPMCITRRMRTAFDKMAQIVEGKIATEQNNKKEG